MAYSTLQLYLNGEFTSKLLEHSISYSKASQHTVFQVRTGNLILKWMAGEGCILIFLKPKRSPLQPLYFVLPLKK